MGDLLTLYKLIILYMLDKVEGPMTIAQFSDFILEKGYTDYFTLLQTLNELEASELVRTESTMNRTLYHLTESGNMTLEFFHDRISEEIKAEIVAFLESNQFAIKDEVSVLADYYPTTGSNYAAHCIIREKNSPLIELSITVQSKDQAQAICSQWQNKNFEVYEYLMDMLLR